MRRPALLAALLLLGACSSSGSSGDSKADSAASKPATSSPGFFDRLFSSSDSNLSCPTVTRIGDATRLTRFVPGGRDLTDVAFEARIGGISGNCSGNEKRIQVQMNAQFIASRGPADKGRKAPFDYFVAITDNNENVLVRQEFNTIIPFPGNQTRSGVEEQLDQTIPIVKGQQGSDFHIFIGFVLTPEEIAYNRAHPHP
ncbi:MAG: hypothetical protein QOK29_4820 [Rhodospirillaceae bacterium]|jgi:hypothetical protein|nr:hypothetical protein [Rhodospirillaceae bacterium]